jgi:hypothetical protein
LSAEAQRGILAAEFGTKGQADAVMRLVAEIHSGNASRRTLLDHCLRYTAEWTTLRQP